MRWLRHGWRHARCFPAHEGGAIAVIVALMMLPLALAVGCGFDYARLTLARNALQSAADAAVLAAAANPAATAASVAQTAQAFLAANTGDVGLVSINAAPPQLSAGGLTVTYDITATYQTSFMRLANINEVSVSVRSVVQRGRPGPVEMALVLDVTNSMSTAFGSSTRINVLKQAASSLVAKVMDPPNEGGRVGIVPFTAFINLATTAFNGSPWLEVPPPRTNCTHPPSCFQPCVIDGAASQCLIPGCQPTSCTTVNWSGCIGHRPQGWRETIDSPTSPRYPGIYAVCSSGYAPLSSSKTTVLQRINQLGVVAQRTYVPVGLLWGWNMLSPEEPLVARSRAELEDQGGRRVLVLISDGASTVFPNSANALTRWPENTAPTGQDPVTITRALCTNIKAAGISIYTVLIDVNDPDTEALMRECANAPEMSFRAQDSAGLLEAFNQIGTRLQRLKITQ